jgi:hypothetical protein
MYRKCPEHPQISEALKNGGQSEIKASFTPCNCSLAVLEDLQVLESIELSDEEYAEICAAGERAYKNRRPDRQRF